MLHSNEEEEAILPSSHSSSPSPPPFPEEALEIADEKMVTGGSHSPRSCSPTSPPPPAIDSEDSFAVPPKGLESDDENSDEGDIKVDDEDFELAVAMDDEKKEEEKRVSPPLSGEDAEAEALAVPVSDVEEKCKERNYH